MNDEAKLPLIFEKISLIMDDMEVVAKNNNNAAQGWSFRSIEDIKNASNPAFRKHRVFYTPEVLEHTVEEKETNKGGKLALHTVKVRYKIYTIDGSFIEAIVYGEAADSGDKGVGKAQTYAEKVMLIQVLNIPTKDLDPDEEAHEFTGSSTVSKPAAVRSSQEKASDTISEPQGRRLWAIAKSKQWNETQLKNLIGTYGYNASAEIKRLDYETIVSAVETNDPHSFDAEELDINPFHLPRETHL